MKDFRQAAIERFGAQRVPAIMSVHRFLQALARGEVPQPVRPRSTGEAERLRPARAKAGRKARVMAVPELCKQCGRLAFLGEDVTISGEEYQELVALRQARDAAYAKVSKVRLDSRTRIARDPSLRSSSSAARRPCW